VSDGWDDPLFHRIAVYIDFVPGLPREEPGVVRKRVRMFC
jgi:hypothetical protein